MKREDTRTYMIDRLTHLASNLVKRYKVSISDMTHYNGIKFDQCAVIEHEDKMFKVIDWSDRDNPSKMECADIIKDDLCQYVLKCQYNPEWKVPKLRPFFYFEKTNPLQFSNKLDRLRNVRKNDKNIYWKGNNHMGRDKVLKSLSRMLNHDYDSKVELNKHHEEIACHKLALSLPGLGNSCHREYECFGIGTVVISPKFKNLNWMPLIPDHHYICVDNWLHLEAKLNMLSDRIDLIRSNAMEYYDTYIRFENSVKWLEHLLEL